MCLPHITWPGDKTNEHSLELYMDPPLEYRGLTLNQWDEYGLKLAPKKCEFFKDKLKYLLYMVSAEGIETDPNKMSKVKEWPAPHDQDGLRQFQVH